MASGFGDKCLILWTFLPHFVSIVKGNTGIYGLYICIRIVPGLDCWIR